MKRFFGFYDRREGISVGQATCAVDDGAIAASSVPQGDAARGARESRAKLHAPAIALVGPSCRRNQPGKSRGTLLIRTATRLPRLSVIQRRLLLQVVYARLEKTCSRVF
ncbi:hypothetical protein MRX96_021458 [Rhipicephalus microplus]